MIVVTGGSGKAGRACMADLMEHGYDVVSVDVAKPTDLDVPHTVADVTDFGQTMAALAGIDERTSDVTGVVHLAAIPAPGLAPNHVTFATNTVSTYNVFEAARRLGIRNVVWASSETVLGLPFDVPPPYVPVDEEYPGRPESAYSLSKLLGEQMAEQFCRWEPEMKIIGLRLSNVMLPDDYARFPGFQDDPALRKWNLWGYIDARDAAQAIRLALESEITGAEVFVIANADTVMQAPNDKLLDAVFPDVPRRRDVGVHDTLLAIDKARRVLGYEPRYGWREER
ncbi:NAD-dependent epimerase/dehydratase family protein [Phytoactinopolyspora halotolerans]|uniref:NAD(P)-dependent oxidoreductase n=1 Tax=Phytoactinopolyspora halotolerans TaxID=1981512 RepID=A0A6L9S1U3_9ACTN|nr:NAD(P)-dependent oxidoreductase [Phytoactinopolyspora halotolerans]NED99474.1 NAD(P)-dependent oxidoreductase [Phytoactinopolyspora halotolerans]